MSCGIGRALLHNQKVSEAGKANRSKNSLQLNAYRRSPQDSRFSSFNLRNTDQRCAILTLPALEIDGQLRIVALPLQYFDHTNGSRTGTQVNMNCLYLVSSPASIDSFKVDGGETHKGPRSETSRSSKPFRTRSLSSRSNVQSQLRNQTVANKTSRSSEASCSSSRHSAITCNDSSAVMSKGSNATTLVDCNEDNKSSKRNSRKKAKRKGKQRKKRLRDVVGSKESEVCAEYTCESSNGVVTRSHSQNISTRDIDEVISESILPSQAHKFHGKHHTDSSEIGCEDQQPSRSQALVLDSVSVGSKSEEGMSSGAGHIVNGNGREVSQSEQPGSKTKKGSLYHENSLCSISKTCDNTEGTKLGLARSSFDGRKVAQGKRVQKNAVEKGDTELKKTSSVCSKLDVISKDAPLQNRNITTTSLPITDDKRKLKNKNRRRKSKRKVGPSSKQESCSYTKKESIPNKVNLNAHAKTSMPTSGILDNELTSLDDNGVIKNHSRPSSQLNHARVDTMKSESVNDFKVGPTSMEPCDESVCDTASGLNNQDSLGQNSCVPSDQSNLLVMEHSNGPDAKDGTCSKNVHVGRMCSSIVNDSRYIPKVGNMNSGINENGANFLIEKTNGDTLSTDSSDLNKIAKALNDGYRAQMASEAVQIATGGPIAEFERLLHFCSPVICHSYSSVGCESCLLDDKVPKALLCRHVTPNIPLRCLWQWYEKHSSYGLEIRTEDYENPNRSRVDQVESRAYFVPFLSAVQLFRNSKTHSTPGVSEAYDNDPTSTNSTNRIFSVDMELVFEYFETEQPHQRRALYEKIQELVKDNVSPNCKLYGDPVYLNSINMHDLHPRSWYSVAWYPIYRIPYGNFRAAFLTYHSLGHFVRRRSSKFDYTGGADACIVSPVVGLKSYSAQGECWFQPRRSTTTNITYAKEGVVSRSRILKERLRTLEETASLMARGVVNKGNGTSINRHPDYDFFVSRQRG